MHFCPAEPETWDASACGPRLGMPNRLCPDGVNWSAPFTTWVLTVTPGRGPHETPVMFSVTVAAVDEVSPSASVTR